MKSVTPVLGPRVSEKVGVNFSPRLFDSLIGEVGPLVGVTQEPMSFVNDPPFKLSPLNKGESRIVLRIFYRKKNKHTG